mmetsp:Transcript_4630/g.5067  ORF Transcript_4630/g.5067 Transcript_4630/m.5067 type:complete len:164 (+) Transcript_4630:21-512(+)
MDKMERIAIKEGGLDDPRVINLLNIHLTNARAATIEGNVWALDLSGLKVPEIRFWTIWDEDSDSLLGMGAIKRLSPSHYELKSVHTAEVARGRGVATRMLQHLIRIAKELGAELLSLETGSWSYFHPAREMYKKYGFVECGPFGDYPPDINSIFMTKDLSIEL